MELRVLEAMRVRKIFKLFCLLLLNTTAMIISFGYVLKIDNANIFVIAFLFYLVIYGLIFTIPKNFENNVKKKLLPYLLKNIIKDEGEIKWQGEEFVIEDTSQEEKIIEKLEKDINNSCKKTLKADIKVNKFIEYFSEKGALEEKEVLTQAEEFRLKELDNLIKEEEKLAEDLAREAYNVRIQMLKALENNRNLSQYSKDDLVKIEYIKKENQKYEESLEFENLRFKNDDELTAEEKVRKEYLQKKSDEYNSKLDDEIRNISADTDRGLCLFELFNRTIGYDDVFYGNYKGNEFIAIEGKEEKVFNGTVIRIPLKKEFNNILLVLSKKFNVIPINGIAGLQTGLHSMKLKTFAKHTVWAENSNNISDVIDDKFIQYVNSSNNSFSYMFKEGYAYLIWSHKKDFFKLGSLFKKIDNQKQYQNFEKDLCSMLCEVEKLANNL